MPLPLKPALCSAVALIAVALHPASWSAPTCSIGSSNFTREGFIARDVSVRNPDSAALLNWQVDVRADLPAKGLKVWGDAEAFAQADAQSIRVTPKPAQLASQGTAVFSLKASSAGLASQLSCKVVVHGAPAPAPTPAPAPVPAPAPPPGGDKCVRSQPTHILSQGFDSFSPGTPLLGEERKFKSEFCIALRSLSGFGNDAEPAISTLTGKARDDRLAREAKGQYNGASNTVRLSIDRQAQNVRSGQSLRVLFPQGTNTSSHSGAQFDINIPGAPSFDRVSKKIVASRFDEDLYISYWVKFDPNFDWAFGGKLPGFYAIEAYNNPSRDNEVKSRLMWRENGALEFYLHTQHDPRERLLWNNIPGKSHVALTRNRWHHIQFRMRLNTVSGGTVKADGILQGWLDGELAADWRDLRFRNSAKVNLNTVFFSTFHGGSSGNAGPGEVWWPSRDGYAWFDSIEVSTQPIISGH